MVVGDVAGDDQIEVRDVQRGRVHRVGMSGFNHVKRASLELEMPVIKRLGQRERVGDLTGKSCASPGVLRRRVHLSDRSCGGKRTRIREASEQHGQTKPVVGVAVRDVDRREPSIV